MGRGQRADDKRQEILSAARALFVTQGYADTGMEVVARNATVSTATLYAHFPSKADLFHTTVDDLITDIAAQVARGTSSHGDARTRLTRFAEAYAGFCCNPATRAVMRMVCAERRRFGAHAHTVEARTHDEIGGAAMRLIADIAAKGEISVDRPAWAASQLLGMIEHSTLIYGLVRGDEVQPERSLGAICEDAVTTFLARYGVRGTAG